MSNDGAPTLGVVFGALIYAKRTAAGLSQQQLAEAASLHPMALSKLERGVHQDVGLCTVHALAVGFSRYGDHETTVSLVTEAESWHEVLCKDPPTGSPKGAALAAVLALRRTG